MNLSQRRFIEAYKRREYSIKKEKNADCKGARTNHTSEQIAKDMESFPKDKIYYAKYGESNYKTWDLRKSTAMETGTDKNKAKFYGAK